MGERGIGEKNIVIRAIATRIESLRANLRSRLLVARLKPVSDKRDFGNVFRALGRSANINNSRHGFCLAVKKLRLSDKLERFALSHFFAS